MNDRELSCMTHTLVVHKAHTGGKVVQKDNVWMATDKDDVEENNTLCVRLVPRN